MAREKNLNEKLEDAIAVYRKEIADAFRAGIDDVVDRVVLSDVLRAIERGDPDQAFRLLGFSEAAMRPLSAAIERAFEAGGVIVAGEFPKRLFSADGPVIFRFDVRNSRAEKWVREKSGGMITRIGADASTAVRNVMFEGLRDGRNPRNIALDIVGRLNRKTGKREGGLIGLNIPQERWAANMRRELETLDPNYFNKGLRDKRSDRTIQRMFDAGKVDAETINRTVGKYKDRLLVLRGETIARDGAMESLNHSEYEALKQVQDLGTVGKGGIKKAWDSSGDDGRTRVDHLAMEGQTVGIDDAFTFVDGTKAMHPQDRSLGASADQLINCRCRMRTVVDWLADID